MINSKYRNMAGLDRWWIVPWESKYTWWGWIQPIPWRGKIDGTILWSSDFCKWREKNVYMNWKPVGCAWAPIFNPAPPEIWDFDDIKDIKPLNDDESDENPKKAEDFIFEPLSEEEYVSLVPRLEAAREKLTGYENSRISKILLVKSIREKWDTSMTLIQWVTIGTTIILTPSDLENTLFHESWHVIDKFLKWDNVEMKKDVSDKEYKHNKWLLWIVEEQITIRSSYINRLQKYKAISTEWIDELHTETLEAKKAEEDRVARLFEGRVKDWAQKIRETASEAIKSWEYIWEWWTALREPAEGFFTEYSSYSANEDQAEIWKWIHNPSFQNSRWDTLIEAQRKDPLLKEKVHAMIWFKPSAIKEIFTDYKNRLKKINTPFSTPLLPLQTQSPPNYTSVLSPYK